MPERRLALYSRVSTDHQVERDSLANQEEMLLRYARQSGQSYELYRDAGLSAKDTDRPALQRMMKAVEGGEIEAVVITKLDRISRNLKDLAILLDRLKELGVGFISLTQGIDTKTPTGRLIYQVLGGLGEWEREMTRERVAESMRIRARRKLWNGGPTPFGYRHDAERKTLKVDQAEAQVVRQIFDLYLHIGTFRGVANRLNECGFKTRRGHHWAANSVRRVLTNPVYYGALAYNRRKAKGNTSKPLPAERHIIVEGVFQPVIKKETFLEARRQIEESRKIAPATKGSSYLLSGLVRCGYCESPMYGYQQRVRGRSYSYYRCNGHASKGQAFCPGMRIDLAQLDDLILEELKSFKTRPEKISRRVKSQRSDTRLKSELETVRRAVSALDRKKERIFELFEEEIITKREFRQRREVLEGRQDELRRRQDELESLTAVNQKLDSRSTAALLGDLAEVLSNLDAVEERRQLLRAALGKVVIHRHTIEYSVYGLPTDLVDWRRTGKDS